MSEYVTKTNLCSIRKYEPTEINGAFTGHLNHSFFLNETAMIYQVQYER